MDNDLENVSALDSMGWLPSTPRSVLQVSQNDSNNILRISQFIKAQRYTSIIKHDSFSSDLFGDQFFFACNHVSMTCTKGNLHFDHVFFAFSPATVGKIYVTCCMHYDIVILQIT
jgi:hypothetical protein